MVLKKTFVTLPFQSIFTDRKGRLYFHRCLSIHGGGGVCLLQPTGGGGVCLLGGSLSRGVFAYFSLLGGGSCLLGGLCPGGAWMETPPPHTAATAVVGTHPTGMHSCGNLNSLQHCS